MVFSRQMLLVVDGFVVAVVVMLLCQCVDDAGSFL